MLQKVFEARERRKKCRYRVQLPVLFRWSNDIMHTEGGFTRDVSVKSFFVTSTVTPPLKTHLQCQILMPASVNIAGNAMKATGRVVRLSTHGEGPGFAVSANFYSYKKPTKISIQ